MQHFASSRGRNFVEIPNKSMDMLNENINAVVKKQSFSWEESKQWFYQPCENVPAA